MDTSSLEEFPPAFQKHLTPDDLKENSTLQSLGSLKPQLDLIQQHADSIDTILDIGCNRGGFVSALGDYISASEVYGVEIDEAALIQAQERGVEVFDINIESDPIPLKNNTVDLILSFGVVEHLRYFDQLFSEATRLLNDGWFWISFPNLGSWVNRFALLTGYQPRNVEISTKYAAGVLPIYNRDSHINHVHAPTYKAVIDLLKYYQFEPIKSTILTPYQRSTLDRTLDRIFSIMTSWGRRVSILSRTS